MQINDAKYRVQGVSLGENHTAVVSAMGTLYMCGDNSRGQLGLGPRSDMQVSRLTEVSDVTESVRQVSCGYKHTLVLTNGRRVFGMGDNRKHEMGLGESNDHVDNEYLSPMHLQHLEIHDIVKVVAGGFSAALTLQEQIIIWGTG